GDTGGDLRGDTGVPLGFGDDHGPAGGVHRGAHRFVVERYEGAYVHDLQTTSLPGGGRGGLQCGGDRRPIGDEGGVGAFTANHGAPFRGRGGGQVHLTLGPVELLRFHEHDRVGGGDRFPQHPVRVRRGGGGDHGQPGGVRVVGLGGVAVVFDPADAARVGDTDDHGQTDAASRAVTGLGHMADDLFEGRVGECVELHLDAGTHAVQRHADGHTDDAAFCDWGVEAAGFAELGGESIGDPEDAAEWTDVLTEDVHRLVLGHGVPQCTVEGLCHGQCGEAVCHV